MRSRRSGSGAGRVSAFATSFVSVLAIAGAVAEWPRIESAAERALGLRPTAARDPATPAPALALPPAAAPPEPALPLVLAAREPEPGSSAIPVSRIGLPAPSATPAVAPLPD